MKNAVAPKNLLSVRYDPTLCCDESCGGLRILYPAHSLEHLFVRSIVPQKNCDLWRLSVANAIGKQGQVLHPLTKERAEWEMAIRLLNRPDFIGGYNHGDEIGTPPTIRLDNVAVSLEELTKEHLFQTLEITVDSIGYDPAEPSVAILEHRKEYRFDAAGVHLTQTVHFLKDVRLDDQLKSYLAMMPPLKHRPDDEAKKITDSYFFNDDQPQPIQSLPQRAEKAQKITVFGKESGYRFSMEVSGYDPLYPNHHFAQLTDNGHNANYHKMYIAFADGAQSPIPQGTRWHTTTHYSIEKQ